MRFLCALVVAVCAIGFSVLPQEQKTKAPEDYLFAWAGDEARKGNDFLAVIDADPASASYGQFGDDSCDGPADHAGTSHRVCDAFEWNAFCQRSWRRADFYFRRTRRVASQGCDLIYRYWRVHASAFILAAA